MTRSMSLIILLFCPAIGHAGLYYSGETFAELPSRWRGFTTDHRLLRAAGIEPTAAERSTLRADYLAAVARLEQRERTQPLTADETADLGALEIRLGRFERAVERLRPAARKWPEHFHLTANLGTAWQMMGDLERAGTLLEEAVRLAPDKLKPYEMHHLKLVRLREKESRQIRASVVLDDLFGVDWAKVRAKELPADAVATVQQLALWLPADARLIWQTAELANAAGDPRAATILLEIATAELGASFDALRKRKQLFAAAADAREHQPDHLRHTAISMAKSPRPLRKLFDESSTPAIRAEGENTLPWALLTSATMGKKPDFPPYLKRLDGKNVTITGFAQPLRDELQLSSFALLENPVGCWACEMPEPNEMLHIVLKPGKTLALKKGLIQVSGVLRLNAIDPEDFPFTIADATARNPE